MKLTHVPNHHPAQLLILFFFVIVTATSLFVATPQRSYAGELSSETIEELDVGRASIFSYTKKIGFDDGVALKVTYTVNDEYNIITGIKSVRDWTSSSKVSNVSWTYKQGLSNKSYVFTVTYYYEGAGWRSSTRTLYA